MTRQHGQVFHTHLLPLHASNMRGTMDIAASTRTQPSSSCIARMSMLRVMIPVDEACGRTRGRSAGRSESRRCQRAFRPLSARPAAECLLERAARHPGHYSPIERIQAYLWPSAAAWWAISRPRAPETSCTTIVTTKGSSPSQTPPLLPPVQ